MKPAKLAIISTHPIQYYAPWFRYLSARYCAALKVFYLWDFGVTGRQDPDFLQPITWDVPILDGYDYEFIPNTSRMPGTGHLLGLINPGLTKRILEFSPDAVLLTCYNYVSIYKFLRDWRGRTPVLFRGDSHTLVQQTGFCGRLRRAWISTIVRHFSACLYVGGANKDYFLHHGVVPEKLFFSPHAVDNDRFFVHTDDANKEAAAWKESLGIPKNNRVILFAGKFNEKKRPTDLLRAFFKAGPRTTSLLFVGSGPLEPALRSLVGDRADVFFAPFQNQSQMPKVYAACDIIVLPSYGRSETWGLAINEAMCMSKPAIVSSHVGCAQDLIRCDKNGLIFPAGDIDSLSRCIKKALSDEVNLKEWGRESRRIIEQYSYKEATAGLMQAIENLINTKRTKNKLRVRVVFFERHALGGFSIERVTRNIISHLPPNIQASVFKPDHSNKGNINRLLSLFEIKSRQGQVNHITGDSHWFAFGLDPRKTILTLHDCEKLMNDDYGRVRKWLYKLLWFTLPARRCAAITAISEETKKNMERYAGIPGSSIRVIHDGVDDIFKPLKLTDQEKRRLTQNDGTKKTVLHISGPKRSKNIMRLLEALKGIPEVVLVKVGAMLIDEIEYIKNSGIDVVQYENIKDDDLVRLYNAVDLLAFPSLVEGFGLPILEAQACGCPVVTARVSSLPEVGGDGACYIEPYSVNSISMGIERVLSDDEFRKHLIETGLSNVKRFQWSDISLQYAALYEDVYRQAERVCGR